MLFQTMGKLLCQYTMMFFKKNNEKKKRFNEWNQVFNVRFDIATARPATDKTASESPTFANHKRFDSTTQNTAVPKKKKQKKKEL